MGIGAKLNIVVKVGTSSTLKFNNVKAYRAITYNDVSNLIGLRDDISLIIIESADESDMLEIRNVISMTDLNVYLYNPNFNIETSTNGLLQGEFSSDHVYMFRGQEELQEAITDFYDIDVRTFIPKKQDNLEEDFIGIEESENIEGSNDFDEFGTFEGPGQEDTSIFDDVFDFGDVDNNFGSYENSIESSEEVVDNTTSTDKEVELAETTDSTKLDINESEEIDVDNQEELNRINSENSDKIEDTNYEAENNDSDESEENLEDNLESVASEQDDIKQNEVEETLYNPENADLLEALSASLTVNTEEKEVKEKVVVLAGRKEDNEESEEAYIWDAEELHTELATDISNSDSEELQKLQEQLKELNERLKSEQDRADSYEVLVGKLRSVKESLEDKLAFNNDLLSKLQTTQDIVDISIQDTEETLNKLEELKIEKGQLQNKVNELNKDLIKLAKLEAVILEKDKEYAELQLELDRAKQDNRSKEIEEQLNYERETRLKVTELLEDVVFKYSLNIDNYNNLLENNQTLEANFKKQQRVARELEVKVLELEDKLQKSINLRAERERVLGLKIEEFSRINSENVQSVQSYEREKQKLLTEITDLTSQIDMLTSKESNYKSSISTLESKLLVQENIAEDLKEKLKRYEDINIEELQSTLKTTDLGNTQLTGDIGRLKIEISGLQRQLQLRDEIVSKLQAEKTNLELTAKALSNSVSTAERLRLSCEYFGKALVIPVFGSGSYGITTTVMSLAKKLEGNILILDFDCVNPRVDSWVEKNAMIPELKGDVSGTLLNSSFGALISKGADFVIDNQQLVIQNTNFGINKVANKVKKINKKVDYFSGIYTKIDLYKFAAIDFGAFMNFFGNEYDYILVDLGRIGGNESTNALIRMFNQISWRNVLVCQNDKYDVRTVYTKCSIERLNLGKSIWVLNMSKSTALDELSKKALGNAHFVIMTKKPDFYGEMKTFDVFSNYHKEKLQQIVDEISGT